MEKRIGSALILVENTENVDRLNAIISKYADLIIGRQGLPVTRSNVRIISIVFEGTNQDISAFTGQVGRLKGISVKSVLAKPV
jgi:putative iron-only hydrogenase system regulator